MPCKDLRHKSGRDIRGEPQGWDKDSRRGTNEIVLGIKV